MKHSLSFLLSSIFCVFSLYGQINVVTNSVGSQLIQSLQGPGVTLSNPVVNCPACGIGTFSNGNTTNLGLNQGVVLSTGGIVDNCAFLSFNLGINNPAIDQASYDAGGPGDSDIDTIAKYLFNDTTAGNPPPPSYDRCNLEFDLVPTGNHLSFQYVFGSEEYPEYECSAFTDVFAFFISGPNPSGGNYVKKNIALVPGTNLPVAINTINDGNPTAYSPSGCVSTGYSNYYVNNQNGTSIIYDGLTHVLTAEADVTPCQTYHIKLSIADVGDGTFDSGVFLQSGSFSATNVSVHTLTSAGSGFQNAVEGCVNGEFKFSINQPQAANYTINYQIAGTATNGTDYNTIANSVTIPAGDTTALVSIVPISDGINEGDETVTLYLTNCNNQIYDSATIIIQDSIKAQASALPATICPGGTSVLTGSGGLTYQWTPTSSLTSPNSQTTNASPAATTTYLLTASVGACQGRDTVTVYVDGTGFSVDAGPDQTICANQSVQLQAVVNPSAGAYTYEWSPTTYMASGNSTLSNPIVSPTQTTTYTVTVSSSTGCAITDSTTIHVSGVGPSVVASVNPTVICPGQQVQLDFSTLPQHCGPNYSGCSGIEQQDSIGSGYTVQTGSPTSNITIYGNYYKSTRMQILYTASEINAVFGSGGTIRALSWEVGTFNSNATLENFTIRMKCVSPAQTTLTNWETGLSTVYGPRLYTPIAGWNNHNLDTLYDWDGVSNLVVEICFYNPSTFSNFNNMMVYNTVPNSVIYSRANTDQCGTNAAVVTSNQRPKVRIRMCQPDYQNYVIHWSPATGVNAVSDSSLKNPTANPMTSQNYLVTVSNGTCSGSDFVTVSIDTSVKVNAGPDMSFCTGHQIQLNATPTGTPQPGQSFSYQWKEIPSNTSIGNTQSVTVTPTVPTSYVVAMSGGLCTVYDTVSVYIGSLGLSHQITNITCNGANDGKIVLLPTGASPFTFQWSANAATGNVDSAVNLGAATYLVTVTDNQNCIGHDTVVMTQPAAITFTSSKMNVSCHGGNNGSIAISPSGGNGGFNYNWSNSLPNNDTVSGLSAGAYTLTITDANNCSTTGSVIINEPTAISFNAPQIKDVRCFNGSDGFIIVSPTGGTPAYSYSWSHNAGLNQANATNLPAGTYTVTVTDANSCTDTASYTISQPANGLIIGSITMIGTSCYGYADGQATVNPSGGATPYLYTWTPSGQTTQTATALSAQTYTVVVTDDSLCTATDSVTITQPQQIVLSDSIQNVRCFGDSNGAITLTVTPPSSPATSYTFTWSNGVTGTDATGGNHIDSLTAGTYSVTVSNSQSCSATGTYTVQQPTALSLPAPVIQNVSCYGGNNGSITVNPSGGTTPYAYTWTPASGTSATANNLTTGNYTVTVTDANGCFLSDSFTVTQPASPLTFGTPTIVNVLCNGANTGSIAVSVSGGTPTYTYSWSQNASLNNATATVLPAGSYIVTVTDANSCSLSASNTITQPTAITFGQQQITNVSCHGGHDGSATITPSGGTGGFAYTWNSVAGNNPQSGLTAGNYTVVVTDSNGCTASTTVLIQEPTAVTLNPIVHDALCFDASNGSIDANPSGGNPPFSFSWNDTQNQSTQTADNLSAGSYTVTVTDQTGCTLSAAATVGEPTPLTFTIQTTQVSCVGDHDGKIAVTAQGATPPYNYSATQDGANFSYSSDGVIVNLDPGYYLVIVADNNGCTKTDSAYVPDAIGDTYTVTADSTSCFGSEYHDGAIHVNGLTTVNMPYQYSLDGGTPQYSGDFYQVSAGIHQLTGINHFGCTTALQAIVPEPANAFASVLPEDTTLHLGQSVQIHSSFSPYPTSTIVSYSWSPSVGLSCIDCPNPLVTPYDENNNYTLVITYNDHCTASAAIHVRVDNKPNPYIPNAFSPNGDGNNDVFQIYGEGIKTVDLKIFNRWGIKVYQSNTQYAGWDGTYRGLLQNPGVYVYEVKITYLNDQVFEKTGSITLIR